MSNRYFGWLDFDLDDSTDEIPDKYVATVGTWNENDEFEDELFTIVHRHSEKFPMYGELSHKKRMNAVHLVNILNTARGWEAGAIDRYPEEALEAFKAIVQATANILDRKVK